MVQLAVLYLITARMALVRKKDSEKAVRAFITSLEKAPDMIEQIMALDETIRKQAEKLAFAHDAFYIGRGMDYASHWKAR